jgi:hypothetical protein
MNIEYIYERVSNSTMKNIIFFLKNRVYILKVFKSHIKKIKYFSNIYIINFKKC